MTKSYIKKDQYATSYFKDQSCTLFHREDGPAYETINGYKEWCLDGYTHREDGPAIEYPNGDKSWYLNGKICSEKEHEVLTKRKNLINFL